jgi:hypothetical protein
VFKNNNFTVCSTPQNHIFMKQLCQESCKKVNNAAKIHTPQIVAIVARDFGCEETRTWNGFTVTVYRLMLSTATDYAERPRGKRWQIGSDVTLIYRKCSKRIF